ncbi:DUF6612 family protein [Piscibacillus salipiscarius]|uniref:DUF6612 family protein n=1 Tax=Piscibacillus salipiscarius TaxID=299480 RepID=UPI0006D134D4|nr:DUF6612 family protein [Piscibacillus salipiscarius]
MPDLINEQRHLPVLLELFQTMEDQFELNEKENSYVLTMSGKGENFKSFVKNQIETATLNGSELPISQSDLKINEVNIEIKIDEESKTSSLSTQALQVIKTKHPLINKSHETITTLINKQKDI